MELFVKSGFMLALLGGPASLVSCHLQIKIWWRLTAKRGKDWLRKDELTKQLTICPLIIILLRSSTLEIQHQSAEFANLDISKGLSVVTPNFRFLSDPSWHVSFLLAWLRWRAQPRLATDLLKHLARTASWRSTCQAAGGKLMASAISLALLNAKLIGLSW